MEDTHITVADPDVVSYTTTDETTEPNEPVDGQITDVSFRLPNNAVYAFAIGDILINEHGQIVGEITDIRQTDMYSGVGITHQIEVDYSVGHGFGPDSSGWCPLGELAEQVEEGVLDTMA